MASLSSTLTPKKTIHPIEAVGIGASLGGPQALIVILSQLSSDFPVPIFLVQHISYGFVEEFVKWLSCFTPLKVQLAQDQTIAYPGHVYIAPDNYQMEVAKGNLIQLVDSPGNKGIKPSIGHLFQSMAETYGPHSIGVLLTGMGNDGAEELLTMKKQGAITIAQDRESSLMFGMPHEAILIGAADYVIPLQEIAGTLKQLVEIHG